MDDEFGAAVGLFVAVFVMTYGALSLVDDVYDACTSSARHAAYKNMYFFTLKGEEIKREETV